MSYKKTAALAGMMIILATGLSLAQTQTKAGDADMVQNQVRNQIQDQFRARTSTAVRTMFFDENGDGICDAIRDHDNDGIPNGQDADWQAPKDGTGYKEPARTPASRGEFAKGAGFRGAGSLGNAAFRRGLGGQGMMGGGVCDGTGPKGHLGRKGRG